MPLTTMQRRLVTQFVQLTNATKENAQRYLKNANYDIDLAANLYYSSADSGRAHTENIEAKLNAIFDSFLDEEAKGSRASTMEIESFEKYLQQLGVSLENHEIFVLLYVTHATVLGQLSRKDFVEGWTEAYQNDGVKPDLASQRQYLKHCMTRFKSDAEFFKKVYRHAFLAGKEESQKALEKETAVAFWETLFGPGGARPWRSRSVDWLEIWQEFLEAKWTRSVNKDMWNQTLVFADKTMQDETLSFWSEDDSWPGVIDDFVAWCRETGHVKSVAGAAAGAGAGGDGAMEVDN